MKRTFFAAAIAFLCISAAFCQEKKQVTLHDCFSLGAFFGKSSAEVHQKIREYEDMLANDPGDNYCNLAIGILYNILATPGDSAEAGSAEKAVEFTDKFLTNEKDNPLAMIYDGVSHGLIARDSTNVVVKVAESANGIAICDNAVKLAKGGSYEWYIRFMRANYYVNLPVFFNETNTVADDYHFVESNFSVNSDIGYVMGTVYYYLGEIEKSGGNIDRAIEYWKKSVTMSEKYSMNNSEYRKAKKRLEIFED